MNEATPKNMASPSQAFKALYDAENERFVVDFTGHFPFAETSLKIKDGAMFVHGVCTDVEGLDEGRFGFNAVVINERHLTTESLPESLEYLLRRAADRLSESSATAPQEAVNSAWRLRCEKAAQIIAENQAQMIDELVASYRDDEKSERA